MRMIDIVDELNKGKTPEQMEKELHEEDLRRSKEPGKYFGECDSCGDKTVLMEETDMCGPCKHYCHKKIHDEPEQ